MKNNLNKIMSAVLASAVTVACLAACSPDGETSSSTTDGGKNYISSSWTKMPENTNENLKYFAYFHSDGFNGGEEYFSDIAALNNANVMMINSAAEVAVGVERLRQTREFGMQAFVTLHGLFQNQQVGKLGSALLSPSWLTNWRIIKKNYQEFIDDGTILGFYFDEPYWNGIKEEDFLLVSHTVRRDCPTLKLMACLTSMEIGATAGSIPEVSGQYYRYCTDVMYDSYMDWDDAQRRDFAEKLKAKATEGQYLWACPKGFVDSYEEEGNAQMIEHLKGFYTQAIQDERFAGIVSFSYAGGLDGGDWGYGLNTFFDVNPENKYYDSALKELYLQIGREITGKTESAADAPTIAVEKQAAVLPLGEVTVPEAAVTDKNGGGLNAKTTVYAPDGTIVENQNGKFSAKYGGRYCIAYTATDASYNTTKIKQGLWVRDRGEISTFEDELYFSDVLLGADCGWMAAIDYDRTYAGSRGALKVIKTKEDHLKLYFNSRGMLAESFGAISAAVYNPAVTDAENIALFIEDGEGRTVYATARLLAKKWSEIQLSREYILSRQPGFDFSSAKIGVMQTDGEAVPTFYLDNVYVK